MTDLRTWLHALVLAITIFLVAEASGMVVGAFVDGVCRTSSIC